MTQYKIKVKLLDTFSFATATKIIECNILEIGEYKNRVGSIFDYFDKKEHIRYNYKIVSVELM